MEEEITSPSNGARRRKVSKLLIHEKDDSIEEHFKPVDVVNMVLNSNKIIKAEMLIDGKPVAFQLDSGASVNLMSIHKMKQD